MIRMRHLVLQQTRSDYVLEISASAKDQAHTVVAGSTACLGRRCIHVGRSAAIPMSAAAAVLWKAN